MGARAGGYSPWWRTKMRHKQTMSGVGEGEREALLSWSTSPWLPKSLKARAPVSSRIPPSFQRAAAGGSAADLREGQNPTSGLGLLHARGRANPAGCQGGRP